MTSCKTGLVSLSKSLPTYIHIPTLVDMPPYQVDLPTSPKNAVRFFEEVNVIDGQIDMNELPQLPSFVPIHIPRAPRIRIHPFNAPWADNYSSSHRQMLPPIAFSSYRGSTQEDAYIIPRTQVTQIPLGGFYRTNENGDTVLPPLIRPFVYSPTDIEAYSDRNNRAPFPAPIQPQMVSVRHRYARHPGMEILVNADTPYVIADNMIPFQLHSQSGAHVTGFIDPPAHHVDQPVSSGITGESISQTSIDGSAQNINMRGALPLRGRFSNVTRVDPSRAIRVTANSYFGTFDNEQPRQMEQFRLVDQSSQPELQSINHLESQMESIAHLERQLELESTNHRERRRRDRHNTRVPDSMTSRNTQRPRNQPTRYRR